MNIYDGKIPDTAESYESLYEKNGVLIERIISSDNLEKKVYKQDYDEWLVLLKGEATILLKDEEILLKQGDTLLIEKQVIHEVLKTKKGTIWLCVHMKGD